MKLNKNIKTKILLLVLLLVLVIIILKKNTNDTFSANIRYINTAILTDRNTVDKYYNVYGIVVFNTAIGYNMFLNFNGVNVGNLPTVQNQVSGVILPITRFDSSRVNSPFVNDPSEIIDPNPNILIISSTYYSGSELGLGGVPTNVSKTFNFQDKIFNNSGGIIQNSNTILMDADQSIKTVGRNYLIFNKDKNMISNVPINSNTGQLIPYGEIFMSSQEDAYRWRGGTSIATCRGTNINLNIKPLLDIVTGPSFDINANKNLCSIM